MMLIKKISRGFRKMEMSIEQALEEAEQAFENAKDAFLLLKVVLMKEKPEVFENQQALKAFEMANIRL